MRVERVDSENCLRVEPAEVNAHRFALVADERLSLD